MFKTALTAASLALVATATPAIAQTHVPNTTVSFADLDLSTAEGQEALDRRINAAAREICGVDAPRTGTRIKTSERRCFEAARKSVKQQVATLVEDSQRGG